MSYNSDLSGVTVDYCAYISAHGHTPRGRGCWGFHMGSSRNMDNLFWAPQGTFTEAKKAAVKEAKRLGIMRINVAT